MKNGKRPPPIVITSVKYSPVKNFPKAPTTRTFPSFPKWPLD